MSEQHHYQAHLVWSGSQQGPTKSYTTYSRDYTVTVTGKPSLQGSADPAFRGDSSLYNPEDLLVISLAACHMLSYLALCARAGIAVMSYSDHATGTMALQGQKMRFTEVILYPQVVIAPEANLNHAYELHQEAHAVCFIANSVAFPVRHKPKIS